MFPVLVQKHALELFHQGFFQHTSVTSGLTSSSNYSIFSQVLLQRASGPPVVLPACQRCTPGMTLSYLHQNYPESCQGNISQITLPFQNITLAGRSPFCLGLNFDSMLHCLQASFSKRQTNDLPVSALKCWVQV